MSIQTHQLAELTLLAAEELCRFGLTPSLLCCHIRASVAPILPRQKMRDALELIRDAAPDLAVDGEMHGDAALAKQVLDRVFPGSDLAADVNLLIMPNLDAANISYTCCASLRAVALRSARFCWERVSRSTSDAKRNVRSILNMTALAAVDATQINAWATTKPAA